MRAYSVSRSSQTINSIWKVRGRRPTLRRTCKVFIPRDLRELDTLRLPATYEEDHFLVQKLKSFTKHKLHHVVLVVFISVYLYAGAVLFQYLDSQCNEINTLNITEQRENLLQEVYNVSKDSPEPESDWIRTVRTAIKLHETVILNYGDAEYGPDIVTKQRKVLSIESSIFYCFTVITTIGYGNIAPCTNMSRGVTVIYAFLGVPLMILVLADLGKLFTKVIKFIFFYAKRFYKTGTCNQMKASVITENKPLQYMTVSWRSVSQDKFPDESQELNLIKKQAVPKFQHNQVTTLTIHNDDLYKNLDFLNPDEKNHKHVEVKDDFNLPVSIAIVLVLVYMIAGGFLFSFWEKWTFFEAFYFVFISMTTIGLGDYAPIHEENMMAAFGYLVLGLTLTSMCINVIREKLTVTFQKARVRIGNNTVLNVGALLQDEDHRSRAHQTDHFDSQQYDNCFGFKMTVHRDSVSNAIANSIPQIQTSHSNVHTLSPVEEANDMLGKEGMLRVPSQNRFTFYDSPYNTIQDENEKPGFLPRIDSV